MDVILKENNLYRNGYLVELGGTDEVLLLRDPIRIDDTTNNKYYIVRSQDRLDLIAYNHYKNLVEDSSKFWWVIADANNIQNPLDLSEYVGKEIIIPDILRVLISLE